MSQQPWDYIAKLVCIGDSGCGKSSLTIRLCEGRFSSQHDVTIGVEFGSRIVAVGPPASSTTPSTAPSGPSESTHSPHASPSPPNSPQRQQSQSQPPQQQKHMKLSLWDTAGQETYKSVTRSYFRGASGALLVFDITRRDTFVHVTDWLNDLRQIAEPGIVVVLVGNKCDLAPPSPEEARAASAAAATTTTTIDSSTSTPPAAPTGGITAASRADKRQVTRQEAEQWCRDNGVLKYVETSAKSGEGVERAFLEVAERIYQNIEAGKYDLNDRRSGVKGPGAGPGGLNKARTVNLRTIDAPGTGGGRGWGGGCC